MRRAHDFYATGKKLVTALLDNVTPSGKVFECCNGQGHISKYLPGTVITNDLYAPADFSEDAREQDVWETVEPDWTVSNPPFTDALPIVENAICYSKIGVAMLLRLTFLEPTLDRTQFLTTTPPNKLIVLPRYSFTGDGKTDSVTCAWMIWDKSGEKYIKVVGR